MMDNGQYIMLSRQKLKHLNFCFILVTGHICIRKKKNTENQSAYLVPAFEWVFPPLHQVALTDPRDAEVQS